VPYLAPDTTALGQIFFYTLEASSTIRRIGQTLGSQQVSGCARAQFRGRVADVATLGGMPVEYQIDVRPESLRAHTSRSASCTPLCQEQLGRRRRRRAKEQCRVFGSRRRLDRDKSDVENTSSRKFNGTPLYVKNVAIVQKGTQFRRGVYEKDENEVVGGIVMMRHGENPLAVTGESRRKSRSFSPPFPRASA